MPDPRKRARKTPQDEPINLLCTQKNFELTDIFYTEKNFVLPHNLLYTKDSRPEPQPFIYQKIPVFEPHHKNNPFRSSKSCGETDYFYIFLYLYSSPSPSSGYGREE